MRIPLKFHIYSICNVRFKCFRFHVCHFDFQLNSRQIVHRAMLLLAVVTSASSKQSLWFNGHQVDQIFTKKHPPHLHFRWRNSITGWTILEFSMSFHHALIALGICRGAMENADGQLRYSIITRGCNFCAPRCSKVKNKESLKRSLAGRHFKHV